MPMDFSSSKSLARELVHLRLITKDQANLCLRQLDRAHRTGSDMLQALLENNMLTPFQVDSIKKLDTGVLVLGGNKLLYPIASGSFARVFRSENLETGKTVAVKVLRNRWNNDTETIDLFRREAELGQRLKHPNIVPIYEIGFEAGNHFFSMEFIEGGNLKDFVQIRKQIAPLETVKYAIDIARGLEYALTFGVTHRDLKMTNVLFSMDGAAKLIDFGLATDDELLKQVGEGGVLHALEYSTLEKGTGAPRNDPRSDLFFLGTILYEMVLGQPPYPRTRSREERKQVTRYLNIRPLSEALPGCPRSVTEIVERLLHFNPNERYQSPTEALSDLVRAQQQLQRESSPAAGTAAGANSSSGRPAGASHTLMCIESRPREQDILREYFTRHGYRVLMLSDLSRAIRRVTEDPPQFLLYLVTQSLAEEHRADLQKLLAAVSTRQVPSVIVLPDEQQQKSLAEADENFTELHRQPMPLRDIRTRLAAIAERHQRSLPASATGKD